MSAKETLQRYLQQGRDSLLWKLDGVSEYDARRPMVPTGTNLLGLVKHVASVESGYLGATFGRPFPEPVAWEVPDAVENGDMVATAGESLDDIAAFYRRVWAHSDATIAALDLDAPGRVPWWKPESADVTLHQILVHLIAETHRHAGHADILRETIDGAAGWRPDRDSLAGDAEFLRAFHDHVERVALEFRSPPERG